MTGDIAGRTRTGSVASRRGQAQVVGVALLLGITIVSLGALTAGIGTLVQEEAGRADATRVADDLESALRGVESTGVRESRVAFSEGSLRTTERELRVLRGGSVVRTVPVGAVVFEGSDRRVAYVAGAVIQGEPGGASLHTAPPITVSSGSGGVVIVGAPVVGEASSVGGTGGVSATLRTDVTHTRDDLGSGEYGVAIETRTPAPLAAHFEDRGATVSTRDFDGDGISSVVATFGGTRQAYLVTHDLQLEVTHG